MLDLSEYHIENVIPFRLLNISFDLNCCRRTAEVLMQESGCSLENPSATKFRQHVMAGDWVKADHYLQELLPMVEGKQPSIVVSSLNISFFGRLIIIISFCIEYRKWNFFCWNRNTWNTWKTVDLLTLFTFYATNWHLCSITRHAYISYRHTWCVLTVKIYIVVLVGKLVEFWKCW